MELLELLNQDEMNALIAGEHQNPHQLLGLHEKEIEDKQKLVAFVYVPQAVEVYITPLTDCTKKYPLEPIGDKGFFGGIVNRRKNKFLYKIYCTDAAGNKWHYVDPYQFDSIFTTEELKAFDEGSYVDSFYKLGAHVTTLEGIQGVSFAVWAPNAKRVSVVGEFNLWDGRRHSMRFLHNQGIWEIFIPDLREGEFYKYEIKTEKAEILYKADPYANASELRPGTASVVFADHQYKWKDDKWLSKRSEKACHEEAVSIYEVHIGSWKKHFDGRFYNYRELADDLAKYVKEMGYTHVELMGVMEHPFDGSWGYQVTGYFAPTSRYGTPDDFKYFVDVMHRHQIGVLLDWVPAHFPKDAFGLEKFDGTALYEHFLPEQANHPQWGTLIFNYGRKEVSMFLIGSAVSWFERYHIDGLRVDAVASMLYLDYGKEGQGYIPNQKGGRENLDAVAFLQKLNCTVYGRFSGIMMIAEESTDWKGVTHPVDKGGLGFGFKWNMGWMNDFLSYMKEDPLFRRYEHNKITFSLMYAFSENFILPLSHDEVVHGKSPMIYKMPGDEWKKFANLRATYGYMFTHPGKKMLFMGDEIAQTNEWNEKEEVKWGLLQYEPHRQIQDFVRDLNALYKKHKCLWQKDNGFDGFEWIDCDNKEKSTVAFIRKGVAELDQLVVVVNFTPEVWRNYKIGVNLLTDYEEVLSSDDPKYGGSGVVNGTVTAEEGLCHGRDQHIFVNVPPLGITILKPLRTKKNK